MPEGLMYRGKYSSKTRNTKNSENKTNDLDNRRYSDFNGAKKEYRPRTAGSNAQP